MNELERAKQIINDNLYLTIATATPEGDPWITPVYMCFDERYNFYWASKTDTKHSQLLEQNNKAAIVIYDSSVPEGQGKAVYIEAEVEKITNEAEIAHIIPYYYDRKHKAHRTIQDFNDDAKRRFYKATPLKAWINEDGVDRRIEIDLV